MGGSGPMSSIFVGFFSSTNLFSRGNTMSPSNSHVPIKDIHLFIMPCICYYKQNGTPSLSQLTWVPPRMLPSYQNSCAVCKIITCSRRTTKKSTTTPQSAMMSWQTYITSPTLILHHKLVQAKVHYIIQ